MLGGNEFRLRRGFCLRQNARTAQTRRPTVWGPGLGGHLYFTDYPKRKTRFWRFFLFGFRSPRPPPPFGDSDARGRQSRPCAILRCAPNLRRICGAAQKGRLMIWQRHLKRSDKTKKEYHPVGWCSFFASRRYSHTRHRWMPCRAGKLPLPGAFALFKGTCTQLSSNIPW